MSVSSRTTRTPSDLTFRSAAGRAERRGKAALDSTWHGDTKARKETRQKNKVSRETARTRRPEDPSSSRGGQAMQGSEAAREDAGVQEATHWKVSRTRDW